MQKPMRDKASFLLAYRAIFYFKHVAVMNCIEADVRDRKGQLVPNKSWEITSSGDYQTCWVEFSSSVPFDLVDVERTTANIELLDAACEAMTTGTQAEVAEAAFKPKVKHGRT